MAKCHPFFYTIVMKNPWKKLGSKLVYSNPWISVEEHQVITPAGGESIYGKVHFKNKALAIIPLDQENHTWIVGQFRYTLDEYTWEIPMGGGPVGESLLENAKRELKEETGLTAAKWTEILRLHTSNSVADEESFVFLAEELTLGEPEFEETEDLEIVRLPFSEALEMVKEGKITDAISVAGLLRAATLLDV